MDTPFIRPDVRRFLDYLNSLPGPRGHEAGAEEARRMMVAGRYALDAPAREIAVIRDLISPAPDSRTPLRLYDRRNERDPGPALLFIHGGGWVIGDLETHEPLCIDLAMSSTCR